MQEGRPLIDWTWIAANPDDILERVLQHLKLTALPLLIGFVISLALAIWALRRPKVLDNSRPTVRLTARDESPDPGLVSRAVKMIVGDGRYTPQPFPTVKDEP